MSDLANGHVVSTVKIFQSKVEVVNGLAQFWELEHIGIKEEPTDEEDFILTRVQRGKDGRYSIGWPWKEGLKPATNFKMAKGRLRRLEESLSKSSYMFLQMPAGDSMQGVCTHAWRQIV